MKKLLSLFLCAAMAASLVAAVAATRPRKARLEQLTTASRSRLFGGAGGGSRDYMGCI